MSTLAGVPAEDARTRREIRGIEGLDQLQEIVCGADLHLEQLRRGELKSSLVRVRLGPVTFDSAKHSLPLRGVGCGSSSTVSFVLARSPAVFNRERLSRGDIVIYPTGAEFEGFTQSAFSDYVFTIRPDDLAQFADATESAADCDWMTRFGKLPRSSEAGVRLARLGAQLDRDSSDVAGSAANLAAEIMSCLCDVLATKSSDQHHRLATNRQTQLVRNAEPYLVQQSEEPLALASICSLLGVSTRTLQMAFDAVTGLSPFEYGRIRRLHAVRRELLRLKSGLTVTDIALRCGFAHLGRFSKYYRDFFGESPSETLRGHARQSSPHVTECCRS